MARPTRPNLRAPVSLEQVQAERARRSLHYYVRAAWPVVEPETPFVDNWHIGLICEYLEAVTARQIRNLIINIPPRHAKSLITCVFWPTWVWTKAPHSKWLTASYGAELAVRDALKSRRLIEAPWYQARFGEAFQLTGDQNVKSRYENDRLGHRVSVGVGGLGTGEGGDYLVVDDALKAQDADSDAKRQAANEWWTGTMSTRGNDPASVCRVIIMQRLDDDDLTGHVLERAKDPDAAQYEHLVLPARYEPQRFFSGIGKRDPRTTPGELIWPQRFNEKALRAIELDLGERGTASQMQMRPAPVGGLIYLAAWWENKNRFAARPETFNRNVARWLSLDTAFKDKEYNDATGQIVWELTPDYRLQAREAWWKKLQFPQLASTVRDEIRRWNYDGKLRGVIIEDRASGISLLQTLRQESAPELAEMLIGFDPKQEDKVSRARQASLWCERGCVMLPHPSEAVPWLMDFEQLLFKFPTARIKDPADAWSQGILYLEHLIAEGWRARLQTPAE